MSSAAVSTSQEQINADLAKESFEIKQKLQQIQASKKGKVHKKSLNRKTSNSSSESGSPSKASPFVLDKSKIKLMDVKELKNMIDDDDDLNEKESADDMKVETTEKKSEMFDPELSDEDAEIIPADLKKSPEMKPGSGLKKASRVAALVEEDLVDESAELDILDSDDENSKEKPAV